MHTKRMVIFTFPTIAFLCVLLVFPLIYSLAVSFFQWALTSPNPPSFVGLRNYISLLENPSFTRGFSNSVLMVLVAVSVELLCGLGVAIVFSKEIKGKGLFRTLLILPMMTLPVVSGYIWRMMFHYDGGPVNDFIIKLGFPPVGWLLRFPQGVFAIIIADAWQWTPFVAMILLAALQALPDDLIDSAKIDGASSWQTFCYISLPFIFPVLLTVTVLRVIDVFRLLDPVFVLTGGGPGTSTMTISLHTYYEGLRYFNMGLGSASSYSMVIFLSAGAMILMRAIRKG